MGNDTEQLQALKDIEFIKQLVQRNRRRAGESSPFLFVWGTYCTLGFLGLHWLKELYATLYFPIGAAVCMLLSVWIGIRIGRRNGKPDRRMGILFWLPGLAMFIGFYLIMALGLIKPEYISLFSLLITGIYYIQLGSMLGKEMIYLGFWFMIVVVVTRLFFMDVQNLVLGIFGGGSIILTGFIVRRWKVPR